MGRTSKSFSWILIFFIWTNIGFLHFRYDYVEMHEGGDEEAPLIGRYCGTTLPAEHVSSGNELYVRFKTDHSVSGTGFRIRYDLGKGN